MHTPDFPRLLEASDAELVSRRAATRLRNVLRLNAGFSAVTGLSAAIAAGPIAAVLGIDEIWLVRSLGIGLFAFAVAVLAVASARTVWLRRWSRLTSVADLGWVVGTVGVIAAGWPSTGGAIVLAVIAVPVLEFGIFQLRALHRLTTAVAAAGSPLDEIPPVELIEFTRASAHAVDELWPVMTDHARYAELALNLKTAENLTPNGPGFQRACTDSVGRTWSETCTLWDPGHRFDVNVDISEYPYPLQTVQGSWAVERAANANGRISTSTISMRFAIQPKPGIAGWLFVPFMQLLFRPILARIARGWERAASQQPVDDTRSSAEGVHS